MSTGSTSTTTQSMKLSPELQAAYSSILSQENNLAGSNYTGELTAGLTDAQKQAITQLGNISTTGNTYFNKAGSLLDQGATPITLPTFDQAAVDKYMSPYESDVINSTLGVLNEQNNQQVNQLRGSAAASGALGSDRAGVAEAALRGQQSLANNSTIANLYNQAYQQALGQYNTVTGQQLTADQINKQGALSAAGTYAGLGSADVANKLAANEALMNAGTIQQQTAQNADTAAYQKYLQQFTNLANLSSILGSAASATGQQVSQTKKNQPIFKDGGEVPHLGYGGYLPAPDISSLYARQPFEASGLHMAASPNNGRDEQDPSMFKNAVGGLKDLSSVNSSLKGLGETGGIEGALSDAGSWLSDAGTAALSFIGLHDGGAAHLGVGGTPLITRDLVQQPIRHPLRAASIGSVNPTKPVTVGRVRMPKGLADGGYADDDIGPIYPTAQHLSLADVATDRLANQDEVPHFWNDFATHTGAEAPTSAPTTLAGAATAPTAPTPNVSRETNPPQGETFWQRIGMVQGPGTGDGANYKPGSPGWGLPLLAAIGKGLETKNIGAALSAGVGEYAKESELDQHPTVDNSGPTSRIYYPSEKKWVDTGLPTATGVAQQWHQQERADKQSTLVSPEDAKKAGFLPGSVVTRDALGNYHVEQPSDVMSPDALAQKKTLLQSQQGPAWAELAEKKREFNAQMGSIQGDASDVVTNTNSASILAQAGLTLPAFYVLTGQAGKLPRDKMSRNAAFKQAEQFANKNGVDVSTFASQYDAYNHTLQSNIQRVNQTKIMEGELDGTLENLKPVADAAASGRLRIANVANLWAGKEVTDPTVQQYAFHLNQLRSELAAYNGALQGRTGNNLTLQDYNEAERVIANGLNSRQADGLRTAVASATQKMTNVLNRNVDASNRAVWNLFGVGDKYAQSHPNSPSAGGGSKFIEGGVYTDKNGKRAKYTNGQFVPVP